MLLLEVSKLFNGNIENVLVRTIVSGAANPKYMNALEEHIMKALDLLLWYKITIVESFVEPYFQTDSEQDDDLWRTVNAFIRSPKRVF
jgi:hypothetical protein